MTRGSGDKRKIMLTDLALKILFLQENNEENSNDYQVAIKEAALSPSIFKELWEKFNGQLPSDITMQRYLIFDRTPNFNEDAASECIKHFKNTFDFANLIGSDIISGHENNKNRQDKEIDMDLMPNKTEDQTSRSFQLSEIPLIFSDGKRGHMKIPYPLTKAQWNQIETILNAYKPSLIKEDNQAEEKTEH